MSYKAIYRTYRPQTFDEVVGQKPIIQTLKNALLEDKISHAYLFCGPRGTGKTTMAKLLAKAINCDNNLCNECELCKSIANGNHPDVIEMDAASNNSVEDIRDLIDKVKYAPIQSKYKVYIIDEVHMMSPSAFNAFLKTLEEPPSHVIFILATTDPQKVLPTIISRCQRFDFTNLTIKDIQERIVAILSEEKVDFDIKAVNLIAKLANGGMRDALGILEQALAYQPNLVSIDTVNEVYGIANMEIKIALINNLINKEVKELMLNLQNIFNKGYDIKLLTNDLIDIFKDIIIYKTTNEESLLNICSLDDMQKISNTYSNELLFRNIDILLETLSRYKQTTNINLHLEISCLKMVTDIKKVEIINTTINEANSEQKDKININFPTFNDNQINLTPIVQANEVTNLTLEPEIEIKINRQMSVNKDEILNVLVQANKSKRSEIANKWNKVNEYINNSKFTKPSLLLENFKVVAVADNAIIVTNNSQAACNRINDENNRFEIIDLMKEIYQTSYLVFAVNNVDWKQLVQEFIELQQNGNLPIATPIVIPIKEINIEDDIELYTKSLFENSVEIEIIEKKVED